MQAPANLAWTTTTSKGLVDSAVLAVTHRLPEAIRTIMLPIPRDVPVNALTSCAANKKACSRPRTRDMEMAAAYDIGRHESVVRCHPATTPERRMAVVAGIPDIPAGLSWPESRDTRPGESCCGQGFPLP